ncbi:MAG TPA: GNAT family N-acetyltransferase [Pirellulales bacterium]|jgi:GNAT superfamily N-acetyltransferase|nr:GNAT family N-acetyltransferase [Pirellulales bacterium]
MMEPPQPHPPHVPPPLIRPARETDVAHLLAMIRELADYERLLDAVVATEAGLRQALFGEPRSAEALLAEFDGEPAGFALYFQTFSTFVGRPGLWLEDLFVRPAFRRHGIGRALFDRLAAIAVERGYGRMEWTVLDWNASAIDFYRRLGAVPLSDWTTFRLVVNG